MNVQGNNNSAAGVGYGNAILQDARQNNDQLQVDVDGYDYDTPNSQTSMQLNANEAAAIGEYNVIGQNAEQDNYQTQVDVEGYLAY